MEMTGKKSISSHLSVRTAFLSMTFGMTAVIVRLRSLIQDRADNSVVEKGKKSQLGKQPAIYVYLSKDNKYSLFALDAVCLILKR